jgi:GntR family transcriptional regulator/MocR family aminotransferase
VFGSQQFKLEIPARLLIDPGDFVAFEEPGYPDGRLCLAAHGAVFINIPVDEEGLDVSYLSSRTEKFKCVYVTPSHQDPTAVVMSLERRKQLLAWARKTGAFIIEDDYDSEYRYGGDQLPSLQGLDPCDNVLYVSSLWKVLFPMVRMGFLVIPECLQRPVLLAKMQTERNLPLLEQFALTDFINEGHLERHIKKTRSVYARRRQILIHALTIHLNDTVTVASESAGMHLLVQVASALSDQQLMETAAQSGLSLMSTNLYYSGADKQGEFLMPFAHLPEKEIEPSVERWMQLITRHKAPIQ